MLNSGSESVQIRKQFQWKLLSLRLSLLECLKRIGLTVSRVGGQFYIP